MAKQHRPAAPTVPLPVWQELLDAARAFRAAKPWEWMDDMDIFAFIDEEGRPWFPSVLGAAGQVFGLAVYRGEAGLRFLFETVLTCHEDVLPPDSLFMQDALLLDWGAKKALAPEDLAVLAALGHQAKPRERNAWPCFRNHSPGWYPWFLTGEDARFLARCIRALLACAELARQDPDFFAPCDEDDRVLPTVSIARTRAGPPPLESIEWRVWELAPPAAPPSPSVPAAWSALRARPQHPGAGLEFDIFHLPSPVADGGRPYYPRAALVADAGTGYIHALEMAGPGRTWADLVTAAWSKALTGAQARPVHISIRREEWLEPLQPLAAALGVRLVLAHELPFIAEARVSLAAFSRR